MQSENRAGTFLKNLVIKNLGVKIMAVFFSVALWGLVLTTQNPMRVKTVTDVPVSFLYDADLQSRNLVVRGDPLSELDGATFRVSTPITTYREMAPEYLTARVELSEIRSAGTYSLRIIPGVTSTDGSSIESVTPDHITVEIDKLMRDREIPIEVRYFGILPDGFWKDAPVIRQRGLAVKSVYISGPEKDVLRVTKAVCDIQLYNLTQDFNSAVNLLLEDEEGNEIASSLFTGELSVTVTMDVLAKKTVPVDVMGSVPDTDQLAANYAVTGYEAHPPTVDVVGEADKLSGIDRVLLVQFSVANMRESIMNERKDINKVPGVRYYNGETEIDDVDISVFINERTREKAFEDIPISVMGLEKGLKATVIPETLNVTVSGRYSIVHPLERTDVTAHIDVNGRGEGTYANQEIIIRIENDDVTNELIPGMTMSITDATVVISKR